MNPLLMFAIKHLLGVLGTILVDVVKAWLADKDGVGNLDDVTRVAKEIVRQVSLEDLTNDGKRTKALRLIKAEAKRLGLDVKDNFAGILVETTLAALKSEVDEALR